MTMGQRIQQIRLELGLSQEEFGEKLGTTRQTVSRWELDIISGTCKNRTHQQIVFCNNRLYSQGRDQHV